MKTATTVLLILCVMITFAGLVPCLGWLNWFGVPMSGTVAVLGVIGLASDKDPSTGEGTNAGLYISTLIIGIIMAVVGGLRCSAGAGLF